MSTPAVDFIHAFTTLKPVPFVPEIVVHTATKYSMKDFQESYNPEVPYWAFPWAGGQALARYLLDHPEVVKGKKVLDFAAGSGLAAIAAAKSGAAHVWACDIDPMAQVATQLNAARNGVVVENLRAVQMDRPLQGVDIIVAGDVCGRQVMAYDILRWLYFCVAAGTPVLLGDPGRAYVPKSGLQELARYEVPVMRAIEDCDSRAGYVWQLSLPDEEDG